MDKGALVYVTALDRYRWRGSFEHRDYPQACGFKWDKGRKYWYTRELACAYQAATQLRMSDADRTRLESEYAEAQARIAASHATDADIFIPAPEGQAYLPFQKAGIAYGLQRDNVINADEMGLGKTIQAIGIMNARAAQAPWKRALIIAPKSMLITWQEEIEKWVVTSSECDIACSKVRRKKRYFHFPDTRFVIINYEMLHKAKEHIDAVEWDFIVCDECHRLKNPDTRQTAMVVGHPGNRKLDPAEPINARHKLMLTGTPILNRPVELWTVLHYICPERFKSYYSYVYKFCDAYEDTYGLDVNGASNLDELQELLRSRVMVRRLKKDVLKELPPKIRQVISLSPEHSKRAKSALKKEARYMQRILEMEDELRRVAPDNAKFEESVRKLRAEIEILFEEVATLRHDTAVIKVAQVCTFIDEALEASDKIVVFAHHQDVISEIEAFLTAQGHKHVVIKGGVSTKKRQQAKDAFQEDPEVRVFVGSVRAASEGLTLTAAAHVIFAELDWTPGIMAQAEDRCHRIGQEGTVLIQHLVLDGSLDAVIAKKLIAKQRIITDALDSSVELDTIDLLCPDDVVLKKVNLGADTLLCHEKGESRNQTHPAVLTAWW